MTGYGRGRDRRQQPGTTGATAALFGCAAPVLVLMLIAACNLASAGKVTEGLFIGLCVLAAVAIAIAHVARGGDPGA